MRYVRVCICVYDAPCLPPFSHAHIYAIAIGVCGVLQVQQETINRLPQHTSVHARPVSDIWLGRDHRYGAY